METVPFIPCILFLMLSFTAACSSASPKEAVQSIPRIEVFNADYQEEGITPLDTGYQLYKVKLSNGKDTICIETSRGEKYFTPNVSTYFLFITPDSFTRTGGFKDLLTEDKTTLLPFDRRTFYFTERRYDIQFDSIQFSFPYYNKFCKIDSLRGPIVAPMVPHW